VTLEADRLTAALAGRYAIKRELGAGGMATVYLADDVRHRRQVAVKVLRPDLAATLGPERFFREIEIAAQQTRTPAPPISPVRRFLFASCPSSCKRCASGRAVREPPIPEASGCPRRRRCPPRSRACGPSTHPGEVISPAAALVMDFGG
jgi:hypothetical protein